MLEERQFTTHGGIVVLASGDITFEETDAIVNAANETLVGGGGVDGAIHRRAGPDLLAACKRLKLSLPEGRLATGHAVMTPGFGLRVRYVIHTVGPVYDARATDAPERLASCYRESMRLCREHGLGSVAFPSISTGVFRYPVEKAAPIALRTVREQLGAYGMPALVRFVLYDVRTYLAYLRAADTTLAV